VYFIIIIIIIIIIITATTTILEAIDLRLGLELCSCRTFYKSAIYEGLISQVYDTWTMVCFTSATANVSLMNFEHCEWPYKDYYIGFSQTVS